MFVFIISSNKIKNLTPIYKKIILLFLLIDKHNEDVKTLSFFITIFWKLGGGGHNNLKNSQFCVGGNYGGLKKLKHDRV